jgi:APA family basic amino acid/polyamine antiporter
LIFARPRKNQDLTPAVTHGRLLPVLGIGFGLAVTIGNTIGAGIFRTPGEVAGHLPDPWLFMAAWAAGGLYALVGALQIAELGTMIPRSGGQYAFSRYALGEYPGFIVGWSDWLSTCGTTAAVSIVIAEFSVAFVPAIERYAITVATVVVIIFALAQWRGIRQGSLVQSVTSAMKAVALIALVVVAFVLGGGGFVEPTAGSRPEGMALVAAFVLSLQAVIYTYDGWTGVIYFSEEVAQPARDIPRSLIGSVTAVIAAYLLVNLAFLYVLPVSKMAGEAFAAGAVARAIFGDLGDPIFRALVIVSLLSAVHSNHLMASRVLFALGRDGLVSTRAATVNQGGTPTVALLLSATIAVLFVVFGRTFGTVITVLSFFFVANYTLSFVSLLVLRWREPDRPRPYRTWGYPWTTAMAILGSVAFLAGAIASDTQNSLYALALLAGSYPAYRVLKSAIRSQENPK